MALLPVGPRHARLLLQVAQEASKKLLESEAEREGRPARSREEERGQGKRKREGGDEDERSVEEGMKRGGALKGGPREGRLVGVAMWRVLGGSRPLVFAYACALAAALSVESPFLRESIGGGGDGASKTEGQGGGGSDHTPGRTEGCLGGQCHSEVSRSHVATHSRCRGRGQHPRKFSGKVGEVYKSQKRWAVGGERYPSVRAGNFQEAADEQRVCRCGSPSPAQSSAAGTGSMSRG